MKTVWDFEQVLDRIEYEAKVTWMLLLSGEGELEIKNQGRFVNISSFSQETEAEGQQTPRNGEDRPKLSRVLSAGCTNDSDSTPHLFFHSASSAAARPQ